MDTKRYQCGPCQRQFSSRSDANEQLDKLKARNGCTKELSVAVHHIDDWSFKRCIGNYYDFGSLYWIEAFQAYERGVLPFPGDFFSQPAKAIEIFQFIGSYRSAKMEEDAKRYKEELQRNQSQSKGRVSRRGR